MSLISNLFGYSDSFELTIDKVSIYIHSSSLIRLLFVFYLFILPQTTRCDQVHSAQITLPSIFFFFCFFFCIQTFPHLFLIFKPMQPLLKLHTTTCHHLSPSHALLEASTLNFSKVLDKQPHPTPSSSLNPPFHANKHQP